MVVLLVVLLLVVVLLVAIDVTTRKICIKRTRPPPVAEIWTPLVPIGVEADVMSMRVEVPLPEIVPGLNDAVASVGSPVALRKTDELNP